jgi:AcrR family transcriptional regulator
MKGVVMNKQPEVTTSTKKHLQEAFWELYEVKDIKNITIKEITDLAGYNRGTFYLYYKDIYDILEQIEDELLAENEEYKQCTEQLTVSPEDIANLFMSDFELKRRYLVVLLGDRGDPQFINKMKINMKRFLRSKLVAEHNLSEMEAEYYLEFFTAGTLGLLQKWLQEDLNLSAEEFIRVIFQIASARMNRGFFSISTDF